MLIDKCEVCTKVYPGQVLRNYSWWGDGIPIGHDKEMTPEQKLYCIKSGMSCLNKVSFNK
jgi:hypothetical protein